MSKSLCAASLNSLQFEEDPILREEAKKTLSSKNLKSAYGDFLKSIHLHIQKDDKNKLCAHPAILFAMELQERNEYPLSLKILHEFGTLNLNDISLINSSAVCNLIRRFIAVCGIDDPGLEPILNPNSVGYQAWMHNLFFQVYPMHPRLFELAKMANPENDNAILQVLDELFQLINEPNPIRIRAAELALKVKTVHGDSLLDYNRKNIFQRILANAIDDIDTYYHDQHWLLISLLESYEDMHSIPGANENIKLTLDTILGIARHLCDTELVYSLAGKVLNYNETERLGYCPPMEQKREALSLISRAADKSIEGFFKLKEIRAALLWTAGNCQGENGSIDTDLSHEGGFLLWILEKYMDTGRFWQRVYAAETLFLLDHLADCPLENLKTKAKNISLFGLSSPYLTIDERLKTALVVINMQCEFEGEYRKIATADERIFAIGTALNLLKIPNRDPWNKSTLIASILNAEGLNGHSLASPLEITRALDFGISIIADPFGHSPSQAWLAEEIFLSDMTFTPAQSQILIPIILENLEEETDDQAKISMASGVLREGSATDMQRREAFAVLFALMNDDQCNIDHRKCCAEEVRDAIDTSGILLANPEQLDIAIKVLGS